MRQAFIGVDVGTSSARAGVFDERGALLATARHPITVWHEAGNVVERSTARSMCTLTCKWNFLAHEGRWSRRYLDRVGLGDLALGDYARIGQQIAAPGTALGAGLSKTAAQELGLLEGTPVGASLIDAHAGGVGTIGGAAEARR